MFGEYLFLFGVLDMIMNVYGLCCYEGFELNDVCEMFITSEMKARAYEFRM